MRDRAGDEIDAHRTRRVGSQLGKLQALLAELQRILRLAAKRQAQALRPRRRLGGKGRRKRLHANRRGLVAHQRRTNAVLHAVCPLLFG